MKNKNVFLKVFLPSFFGLCITAQGQNEQFGTTKTTETIYTSTIDFPENRSNKNSRLIKIPFKIYKAKSNTPLEPVFWLSGGPGQTNIDYVPPESLLENHDVVLMGYRGVDGINKLQCPEIINALHGTGNDLLSKQSVDNIINSADKCAKRLQQNGIDLNGYSMKEVVSDIEQLRAYLGIDKINFLSVSYGTRVAQFYAKVYPDKINRSVMIGASVPGGFVWGPGMIQEKIKDYNKLCQNDIYCSGKTKDLVKTFETVLLNMPKRWLLIPIDPGKVKVVTFGMFYNKETALQVIDAFLAAEKGDYSGIALMSLVYNYILPDMMIWGDFFSKGLIDYEASRNYWSEFDVSNFPLGSPFSSLLMDVGTVWPTSQPDLPSNNRNTSNVEILILQGELDFSTPHELVEERLLPNFPKAQMVTFELSGHVPDLLYKSEVINGITEYYVNGKTNIDQINNKIRFDIDYGFPAIMKILIVALLILLYIFYLSFRYIIRLRRIKKK